MIKKVVGVFVLLFLITLMVWNYLNQQGFVNSTTSNQGNEGDMTGESSEQGASGAGLNKKGGLNVGKVAPDFTLETLNGDKITLSDYRGNIVFVNFWATWCGPCRTEMPELHEFQKKYPDQVKIIAVNVTNTENSVKDVKEFMNHGNFSFTVVLDPDAVVSETYKLLNIPTTYIISPEGEIIQRVMGPMTLDFMENIVLKMK
ncbi:TlpA family protein disulfide reductase [Aquibacillus salsiterrae]|uniref:TlpA family protein disulfide reductase n=1 Tax=Aquibacillus salsiterrae TaxID=2950439 RepID=A0A9X3WD74_9BACI|nr:TlpA disulfide reductase family protein [Aquibacillus salsiterrae]MDC3416286.1 TlpA family protein disulfide reductase [Aquibacillus salsiterrae]